MAGCRTGNPTALELIELTMWSTAHYARLRDSKKVEAYEKLAHGFTMFVIERTASDIKFPIPHGEYLRAFEFYFDMLELLNFEYAAVPLAAQLFDRFVKSNAPKNHNGTLYGVAALIVARKFLHDEGDIYANSAFSKVTAMHGRFYVPVTTLNKAELDILFGIEFDIDASPTTSHSWFCKLLRVGVTRRHLAVSGGDLSLVRTEEGVFERVLVEAPSRRKQTKTGVKKPSTVDVPTPEVCKRYPLRDRPSEVQRPRESVAELTICKQTSENTRKQRPRVFDFACAVLAENGSQRNRKKLRERQRFEKKNVSERMKITKSSNTRQRDGKNKENRRLKCRKCKRSLSIGSFSESQLRKSFRRQCRTCVRKA